MTKQLLFRVDGTTCASCEVLLERAFEKIPGVRSADVSNRVGRVELTVEDGIKLTPEDLARAVGNPKYSFRAEGSEGAGERGSGGMLRRIRWGRTAVALLAALTVYFLLIRSGVIKTGTSLEASTGLAAVFAVGLVAAFSSCSAVVSGLVAAIAASSARSDVRETLARRLVPHLVFNFGRVAGFAAFGALVGLLGKMLGLSPFMNGIFLIVVAIMMIGIGLNLLGAFPGGSLLGVSKRVARFVERRNGRGRAATVAALGALTFFLPCGFTQSVQLFAASTGSAAQGAIVMAVFALGTVPALLGLGFAATTARGRTLKTVSLVIGVFVIAIGFSNLAGAANLLDGGGGAAKAADSRVVLVENGEQVIQMEITPQLEYAPDILYVRVGEPVRWDIFGTDQLGCASSLVLREFNVNATLKTGFNTLRFTPDKTGTFRFTCSMGMTRGTLVVMPYGK